MPELPEVETVRRALARHLVGRRVIGLEATAGLRLRLARPVDLTAVRRASVGRTIRGVRRRAKQLLVEFEDRRALVFHLGMTGSFRIVAASESRLPHEHLRFALDDGSEWRFRDPRRFGSVEAWRLTRPGAWPPAVSRLGPEPLGRGFNADALLAALRGRQGPIKALLLDQRLVAGIGNIYASEACHHAGLGPATPATALDRAACQALVEAIRQVLRRAIRRGGSTIRDYASVNGSEGSFHLELTVYGRTGGACRRPGCRGVIQRSIIAGRSTWHCPSCQATLGRPRGGGRRQGR
jgi:formamidopyrimidine-DNA glycosylase